MSELKPETMDRRGCRHCGTKGRYPRKQYVKDHENINLQHKKYACWCSKCGCDGPIADTEVEAIQKWNKWTKPDNRRLTKYGIRLTTDVINHKLCDLDSGVHKYEDISLALFDDVVYLLNRVKMMPVTEKEPVKFTIETDIGVDLFPFNGPIAGKKYEVSKRLYNIILSLLGMYFDTLCMTYKTKDTLGRYKEEEDDDT